jgi:hypothetical protein
MRPYFAERSSRAVPTRGLTFHAALTDLSR